MPNSAFSKYDFRHVIPTSGMEKGILYHRPLYLIMAPLLVVWNVDSKCSDVPGVMHPLMSFTFGGHYGASFSLYAGKGKYSISNTAYGLVILCKFVFQKWIILTQNSPIRIHRDVFHLWSPLFLPARKWKCFMWLVNFWGSLWSILFSACRELEMLHMAW